MRPKIFDFRVEQQHIDMLETFGMTILHGVELIVELNSEQERIVEEGGIVDMGPQTGDRIGLNWKSGYFCVKVMAIQMREDKLYDVIVFPNLEIVYND